MREIPDKWRIFSIYLALVIIIRIVFWQAHSLDFISYDDDVYVTENPHVVTGVTTDNIIWAFTATHFHMWHPVTSLSHMLDCELFGLNPAGHHLTNLIIHIANALLLFEILRRMTNRIWPSAFAAAVFALHPLSVESVAWVAERKNVLSGFFWMLTIAAYIRYVKCPRTSNYLLLIFVFALALMSKPTTVTLPFVLLLLDYWPLQRFQLSRWSLIKEKIPLFALSAGLCVITVLTQSGGEVLSLNREFPFNIRLANALVSYAAYIGKMIYPADLAVFYPHPGFALPIWKAVVSFLLLAAISAVLLYLGRRKPYLGVGWLWFLGTLVPVIGLVQAGGQAMADRYTYIPLIGLFIIVAWGASDLSESWKYRKIALGTAATAVILILSVCTAVQMSYWRNSQRLFEHALKVTSGNYVAYNNLGFAMMEQKKFDEAIGLFHRALELRPDSAKAYNNLGIAYGNLGRHDEAIEAYRRSIEIKPDYAEAYYNLGIANISFGRSREAIEAFKNAIEIKPDYADAHYNLGVAYLIGGDKNAVMEEYKILKALNRELADQLLELITDK